MSPGSTLTLPRSVARFNKRHSLQNPPNVASILSDPAQNSILLVANEVPGTLPASHSTPRKQPPSPPSGSLTPKVTSSSPAPKVTSSSLAPGAPPQISGYSPHSDNGVDNEIYYEALEYPLIDPANPGLISEQGFNSNPDHCSSKLFRGTARYAWGVSAN